MSALILLLACAIALAISCSFDGYNVGDSELVATASLPDGATSVVSSGFDCGPESSLATFPGNFDLLLTAPALNSSQLPNDAVMAYSIVMASDAALTVPTVILPGAIVQTGAGGVGAAAASIRCRLPAEMQRYVGFKITNSGAGDASGAMATLQAKF